MSFISSLIGFLPQFAVGGVAAILFYFNFKDTDTNPDTKLPPKSPLPNKANVSTLDLLFVNVGAQRNEVSSTVDLWSVRGSSSRTKNEDDASYRIISDIQKVLLTIVIWISVSLLLSPISRLNLLLPPFPAFVGNIVYIILGGLIGISIIATVTSRKNFSKPFIIAAISLSAALTVGIYYVPSMHWINNYGLLVRIVVLYTSALVVAVVVYLFSSVVKKSAALKVSTYASFASYGLTVLVLVYNVFSTIFH